VEEYVRALQWILHYYYDGVVSWGWFYPYHYAPFASSIAEHDLSTMDIDSFELGQPFTPYQQLMGACVRAACHWGS
jgi:5'-3' exonuclease